jgi:pimeloyl-ACP methyl ester carboxylesterase
MGGVKKPILKTYFGSTFCSFLTHDEPADTILFLPGFPASTFSYEEIIYPLYENGFNIFVPSYEGSYQSEGYFLDKNIILSMNQIVDKLKEGRANNLWDLKDVLFRTKNLILMGGSFSGAVCCGLAAISPDIKKLILFAPVWDYEKHNIDGNEQDLNHLLPFVKRAYKNIFRIKFDNLVEAITKSKEISPQFYSSKINIPLLVFHDPNDSTVSISHSINMKEKISNLILVKHNYGHGEKQVIENKMSVIKKFLNEKPKN